MSEPRSGPDLFNDLAREFAERYRNGERPSPAEYAVRYPELADQIHDLFPTLVMVMAEEFGPAGGPPTASFGGRTAGGPAPEWLGDFRILREVGRGGMGVVYEAVQESLGRHVALKVLSAHGPLGREQVERFRREARVAARLHHTNIVPVFGVGEADGAHYYAMQFIHGQSLDGVLREICRLRGRGAEDGRDAGEDDVTRTAGPSPALGPPDDAECPAGEGPARTIAAQPEAEYFRSVARMGVQAAEALAYAHRQGVLHRDIKPSNLLLDARGAVWVTDFGLAKAEGGEDLTRSGDVVGTLRYMAPERFDGRADRRSDVYSLGLTLYELATLRPAFAAADRARLIERVLHDEPPRPRTLDPHVPRDLETIVLKAIAREPGRRYAAADDLAEDLRCFLNDRPIRALRSAAWESAWRWCRRNPAVAALAAVVAVLLVSVAVGSTAAALRLNVALHRSEEAEEGEKAARQDAQRALWEAYRDQAEARGLSRRRGQRFEGLRAVAAAAGLAPDLGPSEGQMLQLRNRATACLALPDVRVAHQWRGWTADSAHLDFDAALVYYARTDRSGGVHVRRVADDAPVAHFVSRLPNPLPHFSPDGRFLALRAASRFELWRPGEREPIDLDGGQACDAHDFSPDGRRLALVHPNGTVSVYDLDARRRVRRLPAGPHPAACAAFHPDGRRLAVSHAGGVRVRDLDTGETRHELAQAAAECLAWHPGGQTLAVVGNDQAIHLWDVATGRELPPLRRWKDGGLRISFSRGGDLLASHGWEHMLRLWDPRTGQEVFHTPSRSPGPSPRFGAGDLLLAADVKDDTIRLWEIACGRECRRLIPNPTRGQAPYGPFAVNADGRVLAACTPEGFGLWDADTGALLAAVRSGPSDVVLFEPSGALLTGGPSGVFRWPFPPEPTGAVRLGPPRRLPLPGTSRTQLARSADGRVLAVADGGGAWVLHPDQAGPPVRLGPHEDARAVAVSPDGRWAVTGSQHGTAARVWDARTGRLEKELLGKQGWLRLGFSPDGRWLATRGDGLQLWEVGSWREGPFLGGIPRAGFAFSPAEDLLATEDGEGVLRLLDPGTGREYARLAEPDQVRSAWLCFSPDGARLFTVGAGAGAWVRVWDLREIRRQLMTMGLDWPLPPYPAPRGPGGGSPLSVSVDPGGPSDRPTP